MTHGIQGGFLTQMANPTCKTHYQSFAIPKMTQNILGITSTYPWKPMTAAYRAAILEKPNPPLQKTYPACAYQFGSSF